MVPTSEHLDKLGRELQNAAFENNPRKMGYAHIMGLLPSDGDPPRMSTKEYERNQFNRFFDLFTEVTYFPVNDYNNHLLKIDLTDEINKLTPIVEEQVSGLNSHLTDEASIIRFLNGSEEDSVHEKLNQLSLKIFGGHIEHLVLLCTAKHDYPEIKRFLENRFRNDPEQPEPHPDDQKSALIRAYSHLSVAPVYIRGSYIYQGVMYYILQLSTKPYDSKGEGVSPISLRWLHTTFCIKQEEDHPRGTEASMIGRHKQIRIQGGMMELVKKHDNRRDVFPILLDNTRILSDDDMVDW